MIGSSAVSVTSVDYSDLLNRIIENQQQQITQNEIIIETQAEIINGFSIVAEYMQWFVGAVVIVLGFFICYTVIKKWFFGGV